VSDDYPRNPRDRIEEILYGRRGVLGKEHEAEYEHERKLAAIRAQSHALVWTGPTEELREAIRRWYEAGWIQAESLDAAIQKAAIHFIRPDGVSVLRPPSIQVASVSRLKPLDDAYQVIDFDGRQYELTPTQSVVIRVLHKAHLERRASVGLKDIQKELGTHSGKMSDWFRGKNEVLYRSLITQTPGSRSHYRLVL